MWPNLDGIDLIKSLLEIIFVGMNVKSSKESLNKEFEIVPFLNNLVNADMDSFMIRSGAHTKLVLNSFLSREEDIFPMRKSTRAEASATIFT